MAFEVVMGAGGAISAPTGGRDVPPQCCFKRKTALNINNDENISAEITFGLMAANIS
jgi:hypothetical protein